ncbi:MAG: 30S ribosomal protein S1 [Kiritimatiellaeota bacterium]|nr:30S ribosomal protein S1 [Kiritimatiellota bacterium]
MEELLQEKVQAEFIANTIVEGTIIEKRDNGTLVDIGYKAEGFLSAEEFDNWTEVKVGDKIDVFLEEIENANSMPGISAKKAVFQKAWTTIINEYKEGSVVKGVMKSRIRGGVMVDVMGIEAFLPGSQVDVTPVRNLDDYLNKEYDFKILKINHERRNIVVSRRELLEEDMAEKRAVIMSSIEVGQLRKGLVKNITDFGAFIDLGGMDGLLHITDMSWGRISHPSEMIEVGQELEVMILAIDTDRGRISLGLKQKSDNPWASVADRYPVGSRVKGRIVNLMPYGAFMEIEQGIEGLIHVSEMSWTKRITKASDVLKAGDEVEAVVLDVRKDQKKISLGLRQTDRNPWEALAEKYPVGTKIKGKVRNMTSYGAFVEIENDIDGMIHISDMSWTRKINNPNEILKPGDEVEAVILDIDSEQQRISLGMKQAETDPWAEIDKLYKIGDKVKGLVAKITAFGAFIELSHKIDGLIHISQISKERVERVKDVLKLGDEVEARVIKIDPAERRIGLSIRALDEDFSEAEIKKVADQVSKEIDGAMVGMGEAFDDALSILEENVKKKADRKTADKKNDDESEKTASAPEDEVEVKPEEKAVETELESTPEPEVTPEVKEASEAEAISETRETSETEAQPERKVEKKKDD